MFYIENVFHVPSLSLCLVAFLFLLDVHCSLLLLTFDDFFGAFSVCMQHVCMYLFIFLGRLLPFFQIHTSSRIKFFISFPNESNSCLALATKTKQQKTYKICPQQSVDQPMQRTLILHDRNILAEFLLNSPLKVNVHSSEHGGFVEIIVGNNRTKLNVRVPRRDANWWLFDSRHAIVHKKINLQQQIHTHKTAGNQMAACSQKIENVWQLSEDDTNLIWIPTIYVFLPRNEFIRRLVELKNPNLLTDCTLDDARGLWSWNFLIFLGFLGGNFHLGGLGSEFFEYYNEISLRCTLDGATGRILI